MYVKIEYDIIMQIAKMYIEDEKRNSQVREWKDDSVI